MAGPFGASGVVVTTTTSDSRAETIASGARVATKCSMLSQIRCRCAAPSPGCGPRRGSFPRYPAARAAARTRSPPRCGPGPGRSPGARPTGWRRRCPGRGRAAGPRPGRRGPFSRRPRHHPLAAEDDAADGGGVLGHQQAHVLAEEVLRRVDGDQVGRDLVADHDRGDDNRRHAADLRQPERALAQPGRAQHLAEPRVDQVLPDVGGGLLRAHAGRGRGQHVHQLGEDGDGGGGPVGDQPHHPGQVGVLQGQPGQVPVHGDELAQGRILPVQLPGRDLVVVCGPVAGQHGRPVGYRHVRNRTPAGRERPCGGPQTLAQTAC